MLIGGGAASGKTSLLEAIIVLKESVGSYDVLPEPARLLRSGRRSGNIRGRWLLSPEEMARAGLAEPTFTATVALDGGAVRAPEPAIEALFSGYSRDPAAWKAEYFPCDRRLEPRVGLAPPGDEDSGRLRLTRRPDKYAGLEQALARLAVEDGLQAMAQVKESGILLRGDQRDSLAPYKAAVETVCPWLRLSSVEARGGVTAVWFERDNGARVELYSLSHGEQQAILFALVHVLFGLRHALVLIDEPEAHIHPNEQIRFLNALTNLGEGNQILAATASNELLGSVPRHQTLLCRSQHG
ncbi:MAG TPA: AAA family ATPase [Sorangium sp.]|nr:AAA family ATPase [Sorangium sp.]